MTRTLRILAAAPLLAGAFFSVTPAARAGFDWTPPAPRIAPDAPGQDGLFPPVSAVPVPDVEKTGIPSQGASLEALEIDSQPLKPDTEPKRDVVEGFGSDIPLIMAMHQIVPPGFGYSFENPVDPSTKVTWDGGKPWNVILNTALAPHKLEAVISGKTVVIRPQHSSVAMTAPETNTSPYPTALAAASPDDYKPSYPRRNPQQQANRGEREQEPFYERIVPSLPSMGLLSLSRKAKEDKQEAMPLLKEEIKWTEQPAPARLAAPEVAQDPLPIAAPEVLTAALDDMAENPVEPVQSSFQEENLLSAPRLWQAGKDDSLKHVLSLWSESVGVRVVWLAPMDYKLPRDIKLRSGYTDALMETLGAFSDAGLSPKETPTGRLHNLTDEDSVLVIRAGTDPAIN